MERRRFFAALVGAAVAAVAAKVAPKVLEATAAARGVVVNVFGKTYERIDPNEVAKALGAQAFERPDLSIQRLAAPMQQVYNARRGYETGIDWGQRQGDRTVVSRPFEMSPATCGPDCYWCKAEAQWSAEDLEARRAFGRPMAESVPVSLTYEPGANLQLMPIRKADFIDNPEYQARLAKAREQMANEVITSSGRLHTGGGRGGRTQARHDHLTEWRKGQIASGFNWAVPQCAPDCRWCAAERGEA